VADSPDKLESVTERPLSGEPMRTPRLVALGTLAGFGYGVDLATGPLLLVTTLALVAYPLPPRAGAGRLRAGGVAVGGAASRAQLRHRRHDRAGQHRARVPAVPGVAVHQRHHDRRLAARRRGALPRNHHIALRVSADLRGRLRPAGRRQAHEHTRTRPTTGARPRNQVTAST